MCAFIWADEEEPESSQKSKQPVEVVAQALEMRREKIQEVIIMKKPKALTKRQQAALKRHSVHHTAKHMADMRRSMRAGKNFKEAHRIAMRKVGK